MSPFDRRLLLRVALRMERDAKAAYDAAGRTDSSKSTRDNVMGDVLDLRDYVERQEAHEKMTDGIVDGNVALLPKEATDEMAEAGIAKLVAEIGEHPAIASPPGLAKDIWSAMVGAARPGETPKS